MTNQEILASGPEGWTHVTDDGEYFMEVGGEAVYRWHDNGWFDDSHNVWVTRSRSDIERIVYLESVLKGEAA